jgi:DNA-nicking Smr family endonuclease
VRTSLRALLADVVVPKPTGDAAAQPPALKRNDEGAKAQQRASRDNARPASTPPPAIRPSDTLRGDDRIAWYDAYAGVKPLAGKHRARLPSPVVTTPKPPPVRSVGDDEARARLAALVAGGVRFDVVCDGDEIRALRAGTPVAVLRGLMRKGVVPEATLDLHGYTAAEAEREVVRFVRAEQRRGARRVCIVHGKGLHSAGGPVLRDCVVHVLTEGGAAPVVLAFATASHERGGSGALMVELAR